MNISDMYIKNLSFVIHFNSLKITPALVPLPGEVFPDHVGLPIGEEHGGATYFMMEMHYDNPNYKQGGFESGRSCLAV